MSSQEPWSARGGDAWNADRPGPAARRRDGDLVPWDGWQVEPGSEPTRSAEVITSRYEPGGPYGQPPGRKNRSLLIVLLSLLVVALLSIVLLVVIRPNASPTSSKPTGTPSQSAASPSPSAASPRASSAVSPGATAGTSPGASASSGGTPGTVGTTGGGGGSGAEVADLSALNPVQSQGISGPNPGPEQIGATTYQNSVGFTCYAGGGFFYYNVAGYKFLTAIIGIPSNASNAAGNAMTITFFKDGSSTQLGSPVTVSLDHPQSVHLNLQGSSQLEIACSAIGQTTHSQVDMDGALGNATIGPS